MKIKLPFSRVTDTMIEIYLYSKLFVDTMDREHNGAEDSVETHAQRIASLIDLKRKGVKLLPVLIFYTEETKEIEIEDGWHRIRASYYLNVNIACQVHVE
jgi:hypothetical protein